MGERGSEKPRKRCELQHVLCPSCGHSNRQTCAACGHSLASSASKTVKIGRVAGDVRISNRSIEIKPQRTDDAVGILKKTRSGDCTISTVNNLTLTQQHTTINIDRKIPVKVHVATDPEELQSATDGVMMLRADWSGVSSETSQTSLTQESPPAAASDQPAEESQNKEIIITRLINKHAEGFFAEVLGLIQEDLPEKIVKELFNRFHLRLLGLTKRLEFLMEVDRNNLSEALRLEPEIQEVLAELVPHARRQEVTWRSFSHLPVQSSDQNHNDANASGEAESVSQVAMQNPGRQNSEAGVSRDVESISEDVVSKESVSRVSMQNPGRQNSAAGVSSDAESISDDVVSKEAASLSHSPVQCSEHQNVEAEVFREVTAPKTDIDPMLTTPERAFSLTPVSAKDTKKPYITAIASATDNRLFMADKANRMIKVVDLREPDEAPVSVELQASPWGLAVLSDGLVAVTTKTSSVYLLSAEGDQMSVKSSIQTRRWYVGVAGNVDSTLVVSCREHSDDPERVDVINRRGDVVMTLVDSVRLPELKSVGSLCAAGGDVLVSDFWGHAVYRLTMATGEIVDTLTHTDLQNPQGVVVDKADNVYIASTNCHCVMVKSASGEWRRLLRGPDDSEKGCNFPWGVCVSGEGVVVVAWCRPRVQGVSVVVGYTLT
ncbi:uncharacterized protein [Littorina saxatilis]